MTSAYERSRRRIATEARSHRGSLNGIASEPAGGQRVLLMIFLRSVALCLCGRSLRDLLERFLFPLASLSGSPMAKILAAGLLLSTLAAAQEAEKREPPYRLDFDRVALEKQGDELRLSIRATSNLPRETTLDFSISPIVERYDRAKKTIARQPLDPPLLRKIRAEGTNGGKVEFTAVEPFPRDGEIRIEASFRPDRL